MNITRSCFVLLSMLLTVALHAQAADNLPATIPYGSNDVAGHHADINGISMYYETYGCGDPLLIIHGNGQDIAAMHFQIAHFSKNHKVIVVDSRGHGKSGIGAGQLTYIQMTEDYNALLEQLNITQANVIGWSDGGIQALLLAIHHPEKVNKMAIMGANLRPDQTAISSWVPGLLQPLSDTVTEMIKRGDASEDWIHHRQLLDLLLTQPNISVASLEQVTAPVLVMAGDKDIIRARHTLEIFENLPRAHLAILPGQTHWAPATDPENFNALVERFFTTAFTRPTSEEILTAELNPPQE